MKYLIPVGIAAALLGAGCMSTTSNSLPATTNTPAAVQPTTPPSPSAAAPTGSATAPQSGTTVEIQDTAFAPLQLSVNVGDTVTWTNKSKWDHTVTGDDKALLWDSGNLTPGQQFKHTFNAAGVYTYHDGIHPEMTAQIIVGTVIPQTP